jgi:transcriptional regulator with XRE-family HTH domain
LTKFRVFLSVSYMPPMPTVRQNGPAIRAFREIRGLTVDELAERIGLSSSGLRNVELENRGLTKVKANRLCAALSIPLTAIDRDDEIGAQLERKSA